MRILGEDPHSILIAAIADGAGSAQHGDKGAAIACETIVDLATARFQHGASLDPIGFDDVRRWCDEARQRILAAANTTNCEFREYASTLCAAIIAPNRSFFFQVGDGAIVICSNGAYGVVFWPQSGEYANSTNFLTAQQYHEDLEFLAVDTMYSSLAMVTDGLERLALTFETHTPHPPFFGPLFGALLATDDPAGLSKELQKFLQSRSVQSRSDDDKTLILATYACHDSPRID